MTLGEFIKINRKEKKLTQEQFGKELNVTGRTVRRYENEVINFRLDKLVHIMYHLGVELKVVPITELTKVEEK